MTEGDKKRANKIRAEMEAATKDRDVERFQAAYKKTLSHDYMSSKERSKYYLNFLEAMHNEKNHTIIPF